MKITFEKVFCRLMALIGRECYHPLAHIWLAILSLAERFPYIPRGYGVIVVHAWMIAATGMPLRSSYLDLLKLPILLLPSGEKWARRLRGDVNG